MKGIGLLAKNVIYYLFSWKLTPYIKFFLAMCTFGTNHLAKALVEHFIEVIALLTKKEYFENTNHFLKGYVTLRHLLMKTLLLCIEEVGK